MISVKQFNFKQFKIKTASIGEDIVECLVKRMQIAIWLAIAQTVTVDRIVPGTTVLRRGQAVAVAVAKVEGLV